MGRDCCRVQNDDRPLAHVAADETGRRRPAISGNSPEARVAKTRDWQLEVLLPDEACIEAKPRESGPTLGHAA